MKMSEQALELIYPEPTTQEFLDLIKSLTNPQVIRSIYKVYDWKQNLEAAHKAPEIYTDNPAFTPIYPRENPNKTAFVDDIYENEKDGPVELKGTLATEPVNTIEEIKGYFTGLFKHASVGKINVKFNSLAANKDGTGCAGHYTFYFIDALTKRQAYLEATFEFKANDDGSKIMHHHSYKHRHKGMKFTGQYEPSQDRQTPTELFDVISNGQSPQRFKKEEDDVLDRAINILQIS